MVGWWSSLQDYIYVLKHKAGDENRVADALNPRRALLSVISTEMVGFEKIKDAYGSCPDFGNIFTALRDNLTHEVMAFSCKMGIYSALVSCVLLAPP